MKLKNIVLNLTMVPAILGLSLAAFNLQAEEKVETIEVHIEQENDDDALVELIVNGKTEKFTLADLVKGESRTIVTDSGKTIVATKGEDGSTTVNIDGKDIKILNLSGDHGANFNFFHSNEQHDVDLNLDDKIMIIGGNLSEDVKAALRSTLQSYNINKEVLFSGDSGSNMMFISKDIEKIHDINIEGDGEHGIKIIKRKKIKSSN